MEPPLHDRYVERIAQYIEKAIKEAKLHSSWINPNQSYDEAVQSFIASTLSADRQNRFLKDFQRFLRRISNAGLWNSLSQILLKITVPGVPDFYQGTEIWNWSLVDSDNRYSVNFGEMQRLLNQLRKQGERNRLHLARELANHPEGNRVKLYIIERALNLRKKFSALFQEGGIHSIEGIRKGRRACFRVRAKEKRESRFGCGSQIVDQAATLGKISPAAS